MQNYSEIVVVLDRSGSMDAAKNDHSGGLNSFIEDQKKVDGDVRFTLVQFDTINPFELVYDRTNIQDVKSCELIPRGGTPLIESVTRTIAYLSDKIKAEAVKPDQVVMMIITDGEENSSAYEYSKSNLKNLIEDKTKEGWNFLFLGANIDSFGEAAGIGINACNAVNFNNFMPDAIDASYGVLSHKLMTSRKMYTNGYSGGLNKSDIDAEVKTCGVFNFSDSERKVMSGETISSNSSAKSN